MKPAPCSFAGTISGVAGFGIFVTLDGMNVDGLVHVSDLGRDYFHFDKVRHALVGERSGDIDYVDMRYSNGFAIGWRTGNDNKDA